MELLGPEPERGGTLAMVAVVEEAAAFLDRVPTVVMGVGKVRAATATSWACARLAPGLLLNVGTAGALRASVPLDRVLEVGTVIQHDLDGESIARLIGVNPGPPLVLSDAELVLATGDRFVASVEARDALAHHADLVDMEGYAVAAAARMAGVPVRLAKVVSDDASHTAAVSWMDALERASALLAAWLDDLVA
jgi:adenosylhomocysteine nucleosidase